MSFLSDHLPKRLDVEKNFKVCIPDKVMWRKGGSKFEKGALVWYTEGSVKEGKAGAGVVGPNRKRTLAMGIYPTIFQTEIHAIEIAALENIKNNPKGKKIYIISDSQAALKAIMPYAIKSGLVWNFLERLKELARGNKLTWMWTPEHEGIEGNKMADTLARKGSEMSHIATYLEVQSGKYLTPGNKK
ncbi:ribonuclease H-like [Halyomorpha halys]|uniref:ribonuclease H-like n=1 Tax=Halyomorpha halys TaxID=286706 RepID=UPI0034D36F4D